MSAASSFDRMIVEFFRDDPCTATYIQTVAGVFNPATGEMSSSTTLETPVQIILLDMTRSSNGLSSKFGLLISEGDKEVYVRPPNKTNPLALPLNIDTTSDFLKVGSITYKVASMREANPTGAAPLLYNLMLKR